MSRVKYMFNDWILVGDIPYQVQSWTKKKIGYHRNPTTMSYARLCDVTPILVSEDFLLKNGFIITDEFQGYKQYCNFADNQTISFNGIYYFVNENGKIRHIKYVHEIQHMYEWKLIERIWVI